MFLLVAVGLLLAGSTPCDRRGDRDSAVCEGRQVLNAIRARDASKMLAYVGPSGVVCGDSVLSRAFIKDSVSRRGSQMYAWLFDEKTFQAKYGGTASHSLAYELRNGVTVSVAADSLGSDQWQVVYSYPGGNHSAVFAWTGRAWRIVAGGVFCM